MHVVLLGYIKSLSDLLEDHRRKVVEFEAVHFVVALGDPVILMAEFLLELPVGELLAR